jgi:hypothetical protein
VCESWVGVERKIEVSNNVDERYLYGWMRAQFLKLS